MDMQSGHKIYTHVHIDKWW